MGTKILQATSTFINLAITLVCEFNIAMALPMWGRRAFLITMAVGAFATLPLNEVFPVVS